METVYIYQQINGWKSYSSIYVEIILGISDDAIAFNRNKNENHAIRIPKFQITVIPEAWPSSELAFIPLKDSAAMSQSWLLMAWLTQRTHLLLLDLSQEILDILWDLYL